MKTRLLCTKCYAFFPDIFSLSGSCSTYSRSCGLHMVYASYIKYFQVGKEGIPIAKLHSMYIHTRTYIRRGPISYTTDHKVLPSISDHADQHYRNSMLISLRISQKSYNVNFFTTPLHHSAEINCTLVPLSLNSIWVNVALS